MFEKIIDTIKEFDTIIIHRHSKPDGDALGSQIGLREIIKENFTKETKVYLDSGTKETSDATNKDFARIYVEDIRDMENMLLELGQDAKDLKVIIEEGANHSEASWRRRFPVFLDWILER